MTDRPPMPLDFRVEWALTAVDDDGQCVGACVLVLAAGVRRTPAPEKVELQRLNFEQGESISRDRTKQKQAGLAKGVQVYLARMGMPKRLFQDMQSSERVLLLDARRLKVLGLDGLITVAACEQLSVTAENGLGKHLQRGSRARPRQGR